MICSGTLEDAIARGVRRADTGPFRGTGAYIVTSTPEDDQPLAPQAYLVEQVADWNFQTHFHLTAQFQVVVDGSGRLGNHVLAPVTVHYAAPQAGYGPLIAGPDGLSYLTIRVQADSGMWCLPEEKDRLEYPMKRFHGWSEHVPVAETFELVALRESRSTVILPRLADGAEAIVIHMHAHAVQAPARGRDCGHQFYVVLAGSVTFNGMSLVKHSVGFASEDETETTLDAGPDGAQVLVLVFRDASLVPRRQATSLNEQVKQ